jgi:thiol-disulfide isomerase/thioredoxin
LICVLTLQVSAQNNFVVTEKSVVKDTSGKVYPYQTWEALYLKGTYDLKPENPNDQNTAFFLIPLAGKELEARWERMPKPKESNFFTTGKELSLFDAKDLDGNPVNLKNTKGKIVVLNFWFINCGPCRREIPDLNELVDSFKANEKVLFVGIPLDSKEALKSFLEKVPFKYTIIDEGRTIAGGYGVRLFPTHVIVDPEGKVYFHSSGLAMNTIYWLKKSIRELLLKSGKDVAAQ